MENTSIGFAPDLVPFIKNGTKVLTYRLGDKYDFLNIGDKIMVNDSLTGDDFAEIEITKKSYTDFKNLSINREGHEKYNSKDEQRKIFESYYQRAIVDNDMVLVLGFKVTRLLEDVHHQSV